MYDYYPQAAESIEDCCKKLVSLANTRQVTSKMRFNTREVVANPGDSVDKLVKAFYAESAASLEQGSVNRQAEEAAAFKRMRENLRLLEEALALAPAKLTVKDEARWQSMKARNADSPLDAGAFEFAEAWGRLMEARLSRNESLASCVKETDRLVDEAVGGSISAYQSAVVLLEAHWVHGDELVRILRENH